MSDHYTVEFNNVYKKYSKIQKGFTLADTLSTMSKKMFAKQGNNGGLKDHEFWAVEGVSFKLKRGDVLGIIGPNGAGKSTILKILTQISDPTKGDVITDGRIAAIIEVTAGFHPDFTGRENIYFNGTILGMTKKEIDAKFDEIVDFSGVGKFIDTPVKYYSSGMGARLGFAVASHVDPDILLIDEVLSVGDASFRKKCTDKMRDLLSSGKTIVLVSHNIALVQNLCSRVILLDHGKVLADGRGEDVIPVYNDLVNSKTEDKLKKVVKHSEEIQEVHKHDKDANVYISDVRVCGKDGKPKSDFNPHEPLMIEFDYQITGVLHNPALAIKIIRDDNVECCYLNSIDADYETGEVSGKGTLRVFLKETRLTNGSYVIKLQVWDESMVYLLFEIKKGIFKIKSNYRQEYNGTVFILDADWY